MRRVTSTRASISPRAVRIVAQPPLFSFVQRASSGETSQNISGCKFGKPGEPAAHSARRVVLGQAIRCDHIRKPRIVVRAVIRIVVRAATPCAPGCIAGRRADS